MLRAVNHRFGDLQRHVQIRADALPLSVRPCRVRVAAEDGGTFIFGTFGTFATFGTFGATFTTFGAILGGASRPRQHQGGNERRHPKGRK